MEQFKINQMVETRRDWASNEADQEHMKTQTLRNQFRMVTVQRDWFAVEARVKREESEKSEVTASRMQAKLAFKTVNIYVTSSFQNTALCLTGSYFQMHRPYKVNI